MATSLFRQEAQIRASDSYDDTLDPANAESSATSLQDDLNYHRSALRVAKGTTNWNDAVTEDLETLAARTKLEDRKICYLKQNTVDVTVPASQNYVELGAGEFPSEGIAIGAATEGAIVVQLVGAIGSHSTDTTPSGRGNVVHVRDAATNQPVLDSGGLEVFGLLQVGNLASDGNSFTSSGNDQAQISFVTQDPTTEALQAVAVGDIENAVIEYGYRVRSNLRDMPEDAFDSTFNSAAPAGATSLTLDTAYNGGSLVTVDTTDVEWRLTDNVSHRVADAGGVGILEVDALAAGDQVVITADSLDINNTNAVDVSAGMSVDTAGTQINLGVTAGQIDATALEVQATTGNLDLVSTSGDVALTAGADLCFDDSRTALIPLSDISNTTLFGGATSLLGAINAAGAAGGVALTIGRVSVNAGGIAPNTTVTAANTTQLTDAPNALVAYADADEFTDNLLILVDGVLQASGINAASNNDVYADGTAASGEMAFEFFLDEGSIITIIKLA